MVLIIAALSTLTACVTDTGEPDVTATDFAGTEAGFGYACHPVYNPNELITPCFGDNGAKGMCALGVCRQECINEQTCPKHYTPIFTVEERCWCEPNREPWENLDVAPAMEGK